MPDHNRSSQIILLLAFVLHAVTVRAQDQRQRLDTTQRDITRVLSNQAQPPPLVGQAIADDRTVIEAAAPTVVESWTRSGQSPNDAVAGLSWSWYLLRVGPSALPLTVRLSGQAIVIKAAKLGKLVINSKPDGATLIVDSAQWPEGTNREGWADVGQRRIRVEKAGLPSAENTCEVRRDKVSTFEATLSTAGSHAECK